MADQSQAHAQALQTFLRDQEALSAEVAFDRGHALSRTLDQVEEGHVASGECRGVRFELVLLVRGGHRCRHWGFSLNGAVQRTDLATLALAREAALGAVRVAAHQANRA